MTSEISRLGDQLVTEPHLTTVPVGARATNLQVKPRVLQSPRAKPSTIANHSTFGTQASDVGDGEAPAAVALPALAELCDGLRELQVFRKHYIRQRAFIALPANALLRRALGWRASLPKSERDRINAVALKFWKEYLRQAADSHKAAAGARVRKRKRPDPPAIPPSFEMTIRLAAHHWGAADREYQTFCRAMRDHAARLPVWPAASRIKGFGLIGLGIIVGEAGDLGNFATVSKLWKYLGLAPAGCYPAGKNGKRKIPRAVKGQIIGAVGASLLQGNKGDYKAVYDAAKTKFLPFAKSKMHAHNYALRVMTKRLVADLWGAWRAAARVLMETKVVLPPPAASIDERAA